MTLEKFLEKANKRIKKKFGVAGFDAGTDFYIVDYGTPVVTILGYNTGRGFRLNIDFSEEFNRKNESDEYSVKELVNRKVKEAVREYQAYVDAELLRSPDPEIVSDLPLTEVEDIPLEEERPANEPFPTQEEEIEEDEDYNEELEDSELEEAEEDEEEEEEDSGRNGSDANFENNIHNNCGIPYNNEYYSLEEYVRELVPYVAEKMKISEEDLLVYPVERENGQSFYLMDIVGHEETPNSKAINLNEYYRNYRTSEALDSKLFKKAAKEIKRSLSGRTAQQSVRPLEDVSRQQDAQESQEASVSDTSVILATVFPKIDFEANFEGNDRIWSENTVSNFGKIGYYYKKGNTSCEVTEKLLADTGLSKETVLEAAEENRKATPLTKAIGEQLPREIFLTVSSNVLLDKEKFSEIVDELDKKDNVFVLFTDTNPNILLFNVENTNDERIKEVLDRYATFPHCAICKVNEDLTLSETTLENLQEEERALDE